MMNSNSNRGRFYSRGNGRKSRESSRSNGRFSGDDTYTNNGSYSKVKRSVSNGNFKSRGEKSLRGSKSSAYLSRKVDGFLRGSRSNGNLSYTKNELYNEDTKNMSNDTYSRSESDGNVNRNGNSKEFLRGSRSNGNLEVKTLGKSETFYSKHEISEASVERLLKNIRAGYKEENIYREKIEELFFLLVEKSKSKCVERFLNIVNDFYGREFNVDVKNRDGKTALMLAIEGIEKIYDIQTVKSLLDNGANVYEVDKDNNIVWSYLEKLPENEVKNKVREFFNTCEKKSSYVSKEKISRDVVSVEEESYKKQNISSDENYSREDTQLESLVLSKDADNLKKALELERLVFSDDCTIEQLEENKDEFIVDINEGHHTVLSYLMKKNLLTGGDPETMNKMKELIARGANKGEVGFYGETILMHAVIANDEEYVKQNFDDMEDFFVADSFGNNIITYAAEFGSSDIFKYLIENSRGGLENELLISLEIAAKSKNIDVFKYIVNSCEKFNRIEKKEIEEELTKRDSDGKTLFMFVAEVGDESVCKYFIENKVDLYDKDIYGFNVLTYAVKGNNLKGVKYLLENKAPVDSKTNTGVTNLMYAVLSKNKAICEILLEYRADINEQDNKGKTALMIAAKTDNVDMVKYLIEQGADKDISDKDGKTFADYAGIKVRQFLYEVNNSRDDANREVNNFSNNKQRAKQNVQRVQGYRNDLSENIKNERKERLN